MRIYFLVCALLAYSEFFFLEGKMYPGSMTFKQKWADLRAMPGSSQYHVMVTNIENSIREVFKNDSNFQNIKVTQLRENEANKKSTIRGILAADFKLSFNNQSRARSSIYNLFREVQSGAVDGIPVQKGSLVIHGLANMTWPHKQERNRTHQQLDHVASIIQNTWPSGSYGLPKPGSGCPNKQWREGFRYHDSENVENTNVKPNRSHLSGPVSPHGVRQEFCIHMDTPGKNIPWPRGKYCIYRKGETCPTGLLEGWVRWDDENTRIDFPNTFGGELPDGIYGENTVIYFCCSTSGKKSASISLPYGSPFYLIAYGSHRCQEVRYHKAGLHSTIVTSKASP
ncbi:hypothetical protein OS493_017675 [Desmophyllum pertusum]|uniref:SEA domain-containing protein n=1 Tax=Desmophyllum pertusum TaxID=174260 RepID=A0A9W9ZCX3_9CNID|nr:hypothetical protein OS493_017675 [Desmophyllum pertusum]